MKELKSRKGYYLTQANEVAERMFITAIKGKNVNEADWQEVTEEEKEAYERSQEQQPEE